MPNSTIQKSNSPDPIIKDTTCPVCSGGRVAKVAPYRWTSATFQSCSRAACTDCGMVFASPMPTQTALDAYNSEYFLSAHGGVPRSKFAVAFFSAISKIRLVYLQDYLIRRKIQVRKILEFGPGPGFFAKSWLGGRPQDVYFAAETDKSCHAQLKKIGVQIISQPFVEQVDLIVMSHVLEHVPDPVSFVRTASLNLKPGGVLFIEVPCQDWAHKELDEPHILFFEKKSLHRLLINQGFIDVELGYFGKTIHKLKSHTPVRALWDSLRSKILARGLVFPFARLQPGLEALVDPLERAVIAPFGAHEESEEPAWWLRAIATKA
jgi:SAM-dependent methyltransferase